MFKAGDIVRFVDKDDDGQEGTRHGELYKVLRYYTVHNVIYVVAEPLKWGFITIDVLCERFELYSSNTSLFTPTNPVTRAEYPIPLHTCTDLDNKKTYDSGWSRYDYCSICDKKLGE